MDFIIIYYILKTVSDAITNIEKMPFFLSQQQMFPSQRNNRCFFLQGGRAFAHYEASALRIYTLFHFDFVSYIPR